MSLISELTYSQVKFTNVILNRNDYFVFISNYRSFKNFLQQFLDNTMYINKIYRNN